MALQLITRAGCHLCDEAEATLREIGVAYETRDVDGDAELLRLYDFRVPVILDGDRVVAEGRVETGRLRAALSG